MNEPIFVRTRWVYGSYQDFWRLVELSGFPTCYTDEVDADSDNTYILPVKNGEVNGWENPRARIIFWQLEWDEYPHIPGITEVWHMDAAFAKRCGYKYVPVGGHPELVSLPIRNDSFDYHAAFLNYMTYRRQVVQGQLLDGYQLKLTPTSLWNEERDAALRSSHVYVHVHQHNERDKQGVPGLRMVVAAAHRMPVICEEVADRGIFGYSTVMLSDYSHIAEFISYNLKGDWRRLEDYGYALNSLLCYQHSFRRTVENAL